MSAETALRPFTSLAQHVAAETDPARRAEVLVLGVADAIKAASNDQNVQRLSRELRAAAADLARAFARS